jgi:putative N-acetylmannosamine-6-phosphate epimerase
LGYLTTLTGASHYAQFGEYTINGKKKYIKWIKKNVKLPTLEIIKKELKEEMAA